MLISLLINIYKICLCQISIEIKYYDEARIFLLEIWKMILKSNLWKLTKIDCQKNLNIKIIKMEDQKSANFTPQTSSDNSGDQKIMPQKPQRKSIEHDLIKDLEITRR